MEQPFFQIVSSAIVPTLLVVTTAWSSSGASLPRPQVDGRVAPIQPRMAYTRRDAEILSTDAIIAPAGEITMRTDNAAPALPDYIVDAGAQNYRVVRARIQGLFNSTVDADGYDLEKISIAADAAMHLLDDSYPLVQGSFPLGAAAIDEGGGVNIYWVGAERRVELAFPIEGNDPGFIYHQHGLNFAIDRDISSRNLAKWLGWVSRV